MLEQRVTGGHLGDPETFLDEMFRARHGLLTVSTMSALSREVYGRMATITACGPGPGQSLLLDAVDQFHHLSVMAETQKSYLQGTIEFYQARTNTKMTIAAERLAVIAAVTLPITALSSVLGMNVIVNSQTHWIAADRPAGGHAGHVDDAAGLGEAQGLVLATTLAAGSAERGCGLVSRCGSRQTTESAGRDHPGTARACGAAHAPAGQVCRDLQSVSLADRTGTEGTLRGGDRGAGRFAGSVGRRVVPAGGLRRAGDLSRGSTQSDLAEAIAAAPELTAAQRRAMAEIHRSFIDANRVRRASGNHGTDSVRPPPCRSPRSDETERIQRIS